MAPKKKADERVADSRKRKADDSKDDGPNKAARKDESDADVEQDAPVDKRPALKAVVGINPADATLNVFPALGGKMLMSHSDGGMQYLIAAARADVGVKSGRYAFEVRIVEALNPYEEKAGSRRAGPAPRQVLRVGVSTADSELILGESSEGICFDSEGIITVEGNKVANKSQRFGRDQLIAVVVNLDSSSPQGNTISLFRDGVRIADPYPLPKSLHGQPLFPHVAYRNVTVQVNFGPQLLRALPFKCRTLQSAAQADVTMSHTSASLPAGEKYEVLFPVAFPDEGTFDWLDDFLAKNPKYVELSDRKLLEWAAKSGLAKTKGGWKESNDKPEFNFGLPGMDDESIQRAIRAVAPLVPRHYVVAEVKGNLTPSDRAEALSRFRAPTYKRVAHVVMGEPSKEYVQLQQALYLQEKQDNVNSEWKARMAEKQKKKAYAARQKQLEDMRKNAEERRRKALEDMRRKAEQLRQKQDAEAAVKEEGDIKEETKDEDMDDAKAEDKDDAKAEVKDEDEDEPLACQLSEEEKKMKFRPLPQNDISPMVLNASFAYFSIPHEGEGFDEVKFEWDDAAKSMEYLRRWVLEQKVSARIEDLQPSKWFLDRNAEWISTFKQWEAKQKKYKAEKKAPGRQGEDDDLEGHNVDIFSVEDVSDIGNGEPLFANFGFEDWALLQLRYELYLLVQAYKKDVDDPERIGIHEMHLPFYYAKYFHKNFSSRHFGHNTSQDLIEMVKDTVTIHAATQVLGSQLSESVDTIDIFVKLTEEQRRERQRRIDAGDETARLKFSAMAMQQPKAPAPAATASPWQARPGAPGPGGPAGSGPGGAAAGWRQGGGGGGRWPQGGQFGGRPAGWQQGGQWQGQKKW
eukprot:TRINITY_DN207_c0_g3_i1.p1 TRINITY_DN207_c0_g3~~TRINITY_DN207_c0_g3_i1.p1  ORF type:complete len:877 (+),score=303.55 TRINITY_DN207_c0_g3_i1:55-2631(+)